MTRKSGSTNINAMKEALKDFQNDLSNSDMRISQYKPINQHLNAAIALFEVEITLDQEEEAKLLERLKKFENL